MTGIQKIYNYNGYRKSVILHIRGCFLKKKTGKEKLSLVLRNSCCRKYLPTHTFPIG